MTTEVCEATTGDWLRNLASVVDNKDRQIAEQAKELHNLYQNRVLVGYLHPYTKRFVYEDSKRHAITTGAKNAAYMAAHTIPVFRQLDGGEES